jgi:trehalose synthase
MLATIAAYTRGAGVASRWLVLDGNPAFFRITKRLHHALHGAPGDGSPLGPAQTSLYETVLAANQADLAALIRPRDLVLLHDPQTAGLAPALVRAGATVFWRCHIGSDTVNAETTQGWAFLLPYLGDVPTCIFSRAAYVPSALAERAVIIPPSIDPFAAKNQMLDGDTIQAVLNHIGIVDGRFTTGIPTFVRADGSTGKVAGVAAVIRMGEILRWDTPLVVQVSRWDPLKDPIGVLQGFAGLVDRNDAAGAHLMLVGPETRAVSDDPEGSEVFAQVVAAWRALPEAPRRRIHLVTLPMADVEENAVMVNAIQRHAAVVVQKSLQEGFGLTVAEAMWKERPVLASAVGGIQDQIVDGVHGVLLHDPADLDQFANALDRLLRNRTWAERLGFQAHQRVRLEYLSLPHLLRYVRLVQQLDV